MVADPGTGPEDAASSTTDDGSACAATPAGCGADGGSASCQDACPKQGGVDALCRLRFMYGVNYAWHNFGSDFGGNKAWNQPGVSAEPKVDSELFALASHGASVVRWWVFPDFRGDGVTFDAQDRPTGLGGTALADVARALELAAQHDLYLMLTLFSFDNFRPTTDMSGVRARGIQPIVTDDTLRASLMEQVVRPFARAVSLSPHHDRLIAWDVINEPEWAVSGASLYGGDPSFDPNPDLQSISHARMETFIADVIKVLRDESSALISVGAAAIKWKNAWSHADVDFYQFHIYDWVDMSWPYDRAPAQYGLSDRPWVMGEFPLKGLSRAPYATLLDSWYGNGYGGALAWSYSDGMGGDLKDVQKFAARHPCETKY